MKFAWMLLATVPISAMSDEMTLSEVVVKSATAPDSSLSGTGLDVSNLISKRAGTSDSAQLLQDVPGVSLNGAGGVSSLPAIHGMADDRLRIQVDGMDLVAACPNHMNSALSYIDPSNVESALVFAGITPVSVGGDSIGGTIQMKSAQPKFSESDELLTEGNIGGFYRSNANSFGGNIAASSATENLSLAYSGSIARADNYVAGGSFKPVGPGAPGGEWLDGDVVGSTAYTSDNQNIGVALRHDKHLLKLSVGVQHLGFEGFPNQRMDMTANNSVQINFGYTGRYQWGVLEARIYDQHTDHEMNMGPDRFSYGTLGMPMNTNAKTNGAAVKADIVVSERDILRAGIDYQQYTLNDYWPAVDGTMGPNTYWNIDFGTRDRTGIFGEWEAYWNPQWVSQFGIRTDAVNANTGPVQGYDNSLAMWSADAIAFNSLDRQRTDQNWDMTAVGSYKPDDEHFYELGYARKSHSPNLYQRYAWSTQPMAALMNNFVGDGNGYIGNVDLGPEVADTLSGTGDWHDAANEDWGVKATAYYTHIQNYIDARRCDFGQCGGSANVEATTGFVLLQYVNQTARLYGLDLSAHKLVANRSDYGSFRLSGLLNYVRGKNSTTRDDLYNIMPLNAKLVLEQSTGNWTNAAEFQTVSAKTHVSRVRNEIATGGYSLINLRGSHNWNKARLDLSVLNVFNRSYSLPLGGAYVGQGASMSSNGIPWGVAVPGMGRSFNLAWSMQL
ncbi:MAG: TonB-dependent receptor plug domain-containing protein [Gallionella sp.]